MIISIVNRSASIKDSELQHVIRAINRQIAEDFMPYWSFGAQLRLEGRIGKSPNKENLAELRGDAIIYLWDQVDIENALGYHDKNSKGIPYGFVFTELSKQLGEHWSVTLSHEALELLGDAQVNLLVQGPHPTQPSHEVFHWFEMCDAVQSQTYVIDGIEVSNFVLPLYFTVGDEEGGRNDFLGSIVKGKSLSSFGIAPGGYIGFYDPSKRQHETYSLPKDKKAARRKEIKKAGHYGRGYLRERSEALIKREQAQREIESGKIRVRASATRSDDPIKHVVVLMLENRSFDNLLGDMTKFNPQVEGIPQDKPYSNTDTKTGASYSQRNIAATVLDRDLPHEHKDTMDQLGNGNPLPMSGFIDSYRKHCKLLNVEPTPKDFEQIMAYYPFDSLPALHTLARNFAVCDNWFSSMPGPTWQNRFFVHSGTCLGHLLMPSSQSPQNMRLYYQDTIFDRLSDAGIDWAIYHDGIPQSIVLTKLLGRFLTFRGYGSMGDFFAQAASDPDSFPEYAFIEPRYFGANENDQHPPANIHRGEKLIADVYNAIRSNTKLWESTLLIITYDEHGGFYDHVPPPETVAPDKYTSEWGFNRLGVRVPTILVSPWIAAGVINKKLEHTSILRYLCDKWDLPPLGSRMQADAGAYRTNTFADDLRKRTSIRTDTPEKLDPTPVPVSRAATTEPPIEGAREALLLYIQQLPDPAAIPQKIRSAKVKAQAKPSGDTPTSSPTSSVLSVEDAMKKLERLREAANQIDKDVASIKPDS